MASNNSAPVFVEGNATSVTNGLTICETRKQRMWKSLRAHILSRREKTKRDAELLRKKKKKYAEDKKIRENILKIAQINARLLELRYKQNELEEEKRELLNQKKTIINTVVAVPETKCANYDRKLVTEIKFKNSLAFLHHHQQLQQQRQYELDMLTYTPSLKIPLRKTFEETLSPISESVVIPIDVQGSSKQNYWIIHPPN